MESIAKRFNLQLFAEEAQEQPDGADIQPEAGAEEAPAEEQAITLTQKELEDKILAAKGQAGRNAMNKFCTDNNITKDELRQMLAERAKLQAGEAPAADPRTTQVASSSNAEKKLIRAAIKSAAIAAGFYDPDDVATDENIAEVEIDDDGNLVGVEDVIENMSKTKPHWLKPKAAPPPAGGVGGNTAKPEPESYGKKLAKEKREREKQSQKAMEYHTRK